MTIPTTTARETLALLRFILEMDADCDGCGCPLMPGEVAWRHEETFSIGCCQPCARDAAREKLAALAGPIETDDAPFQLLPPSLERRPERFDNRPTKQLPLFIGANDLPGQTYLADLFGKGGCSHDF